MALLTAATALMSTTAVSTALQPVTAAQPYSTSPRLSNATHQLHMGCLGPHVVHWGSGPAPCGPGPTWSAGVYNKMKLDEQGPNFLPENVASSPLL